MFTASAQCVCASMLFAVIFRFYIPFKIVAMGDDDTEKYYYSTQPNIQGPHILFVIFDVNQIW